MAKKNYKIELNQAVVQMIETNIQEAFVETGEQVKQEIEDEEVIPYDTGALQRSLRLRTRLSFRRGRNINISTNENYGARLYYHPEFKFKKDHNKNARAKWFHPWIAGPKTSGITTKFANNLRKRMR